MAEPWPPGGGPLPSPSRRPPEVGRPVPQMPPSQQRGSRKLVFGVGASVLVIVLVLTGSYVVLKEQGLMSSDELTTPPPPPGDVCALIEGDSLRRMVPRGIAEQNPKMETPDSTAVSCTVQTKPSGAEERYRLDVTLYRYQPGVTSTAAEMAARLHRSGCENLPKEESGAIPAPRELRSLSGLGDAACGVVGVNRSNSSAAVVLEVLVGFDVLRVVYGAPSGQEDSASAAAVELTREILQKL